jgi:hypothetical protein
VDALLAAVVEAHDDLAEIVLRELARHAFEANQRLLLLRPQRRDEAVERALAAGVALQPGSTENLDAEQVRLSL